MEYKNYGYIEDTIKPEDFIFGDQKLGDAPIRPDGQWDSFLPTDELQNRGYETYCCASEGTLNAVETLIKKMFDAEYNYSDRFLATVSGTGPQKGNSPHTVAETLRSGGCVLEEQWPFTAADYEAFYTQPPQSVRNDAKIEFRYNFGHSWVATDTETLKNALTYSPVGASVFAWPQPVDEIYHRPPGAQDVHWILIYGYVDGKYWKIFDSYDKTHKKLAWDYGFGMAKRYTLSKKPTPRTFLTNLYYGMTHPEVIELQKALVSLRYTIPNGITDYFGEETRKALAWFQVKNGIADDGTHFGPKTRLAMNTTLQAPIGFIDSAILYLTALFSST